jgi:hypothetical protein
MHELKRRLFMAPTPLCLAAIIHMHSAAIAVLAGLGEERLLSNCPGRTASFAHASSGSAICGRAMPWPPADCYSSTSNSSSHRTKECAAE